MKVRIENIVATMWLHERIDLKPLLGLEGITKPDRFPGLVLRHQLGSSTKADKARQVTFLIFEAGKVVCVRTRSLEELDRAQQALTKLLRHLKIIDHAKKPEVEVVNIVATVAMDGIIDLERCVSSLTPVYYEPLIFPGVIFRIKEPIKAVFLLFTSGKVVCTGTKNEADLNLACQRLEQILKEKRLLYS